MTARPLHRVLFSSFVILGFLGCAEKESVQEQNKATGPGGTTTVTKKTEVESSGKNPPPAPVAPK